MELNKNGESLRDLYCWKCTGNHHDMRQPETGKGRMREVRRRKAQGSRNITIYIEYQCLKCNAYAEYEEGEWTEYGIR